MAKGIPSSGSGYYVTRKAHMDARRECDKKKVEKIVHYNYIRIKRTMNITTICLSRVWEADRAEQVREREREREQGALNRK